MKKIDVLYILVVPFTLLSCDYYYDYDLYIENRSEHDLIVRTFKLNSNNDYEVIDETLVIPEQNLRIAELGGGSCAKDCPVNALNLDFFSDHWSLDRIEVIKDGVVMDDYINTTSNWMFRSENQLGIYEIILFDVDFE
ncbi:MAG: hypothetical protein AAFX55_01915 [Bacteroidota bacterium]